MLGSCGALVVKIPPVPSVLQNEPLLKCFKLTAVCHRTPSLKHYCHARDVVHTSWTPLSSFMITFCNAGTSNGCALLRSLKIPERMKHSNYVIPSNQFNCLFPHLQEKYLPTFVPKVQFSTTSERQQKIENSHCHFHL